MWVTQGQEMGRANGIQIHQNDFLHDVKIIHAPLAKEELSAEFPNKDLRVALNIYSHVLKKL